MPILDFLADCLMLAAVVTVTTLMLFAVIAGSIEFVVRLGRRKPAHIDWESGEP